MDGRGRPGDNLYTNSIIAIDGKTRRYFQISPHGPWDHNGITPPVVTMLDRRKVVGHTAKIGWMFVLDAKTGEFIRKSEPFSPPLNMWEAPSLKLVTVAPGASGGNEWSPISVDSKRKLGFVGALHLPVEYPREKELGEDFLGRSKHTTTLGGNWRFKPKMPAGSSPPSI